MLLSVVVVVFVFVVVVVIIISWSTPVAVPWWIMGELSDALRLSGSAECLKNVADYCPHVLPLLTAIYPHKIVKVPQMNDMW